VGGEYCGVGVSLALHLNTINALVSDKIEAALP
jgi:hypothetical protein